MPGQVPDFDPTVYGARGDGVTDDTVALNTTIAEAGAANGRVVVGPGQFIFSTLNMVSNVEVVGKGPGSILRLKPGANTSPSIIGQGISHAALRYLWVDYNHQNNPNSQEGMLIGLSGGSSCSYVDVTDCVFANCRGFAIGYAGGPLAQNDHCEVARNKILTPVAGSNDMLLCVIDYGLVHANRIVGVNASVALQLYESTFLSAWDNEVELAAGATGIGIALQSLQWANVHDNRVTGPDTGHGIAYQVATEHDNGSPQSSQRNRLHHNFAVSVATGLQLIETFYDEFTENRFDTVATAIQYPSSVHAQASFQSIVDNHLINVTTAIDNTGGGHGNAALVRGNRSIAGSPVINPVGVVVVGVPASGTAVAATYYDRTFYVTAGASTCTMAIQNGPSPVVPSGGFGAIRVPAGCSVTPTYTSAPTWVVEGE